MELIAEYRVETDLPMMKAAVAIAAEQSTGTWTEVRGADNPLAARVLSVEGHNVEISLNASYEDLSLEEKKCFRWLLELTFSQLSMSGQHGGANTTLSAGIGG